MKHELAPGDRISATYQDGREFVGTITQIENQTGEWSDDNPHKLAERTMVRIRNDKGNHHSLWMDKVVKIKKF